MPTTKATPSTIAKVLISRRTLRPSRLLRAARIHQPAGRGAAHAGHHLEHAARGRGRAARRRPGRRRGRRPGRCTPPRPGRGSPSRWSGRGRRRCGAAARAPRRPTASRGCRWARRRRRCVGRLTSARATATRCCWPPESSLGLWSEPVAEADRVDHRVEPLAVGLAAARSTAAAAMFSSAVSVGTRLNDWKTKPISSRRSRVSALSFSVAELLLADEDLARGRRCRGRRSSASASTCPSRSAP